MILSIDSQKVGVPVYGRWWIKLNADDLSEVAEVLHVLSMAEDKLGAPTDETNGHQLPAQKGAEMSDNEKDFRTTETQALKCDLLAINAATCQDGKYVLLTVRMNPNSFEVTEILIPLSQAKERLQIDMADLLERSPIFEDGG